MQTSSKTAPLHLQINTPVPFMRESWRQKGIGILRIIFGIVLGIDAWFKWQPDFQNNFVSYLTSSLDGQPQAVKAWITFWIHVVGVNPSLFAHLVALGETAIAISLILGLFTNVSLLAGVLLSLMIWSTAEGFGGPYAAGSTDIGTSIIYAMVYIGLFLSSSGLFLGVDHFLAPWLGKWGILASGSMGEQKQTHRQTR